MDSIIGKVIDNYKITSVLGKGGMGVVYKATELTLDRDVALKMMDVNLSRDEGFLKRFQSEAKALAKLQSPNIVSIYALRETELGFCIVMEFVEGRTLADVIKELGPVPLQRTIHIFKQILIALDHAHKLGIIHRDIKPSNIMLTADDTVKVADFGLAKIQQVSAVTVTMGTGGTLFYMSPEQIRGLANVDHRGDIYSLGMTLYETVTGKVPFDLNESDFSIRQAIVEGKIPPPDRTMPDLPKDIVRLIMKSIEKDVAKRYQNAVEMLEALERIHVSQATGVAPTTIGMKGTDHAKSPATSRRPLYVGVGILFVLASIVALWLFQKGSTPTMQIDSVPRGADVVINGELVGKTPIGDMKTSIGKLTIRFTEEGFAAKDTIVITASGDKLSLLVSLEKITAALGLPENTGSSQQERTGGREKLNKAQQNIEKSSASVTGTLILQVIPSGSILVDGTLRQDNSDKPIRIAAKAGERSIVFQHPQFGKKSTTATVRVGETSEIKCYFESYVSIQSLPVWGTIIVDGKNTDLSTPRDRYPLNPGKHIVTVTRSGYETSEGEQEIIISPSFEEKVIPLVFHLKKQ